MSQVLQQADFADSCRGNTIILLFESDFLDGDHFVSLLVQSLINDTVGTFTKFLEALVLVKRADGLGQRPRILCFGCGLSRSCVRCFHFIRCFKMSYNI